MAAAGGRAFEAFEGKGGTLGNPERTEHLKSQRWETGLSGGEKQKWMQASAQRRQKLRGGSLALIY